MGPLLLIAQAMAVTLILTKSTLFRVFREHGPRGWRDFAGCPLCVGVWIGLLFSIFHLWTHVGRETGFEIATAVVFAFGNGAVVGALSLLYMAAIDALDAISSAAERFAPAAPIVPSSPRPPIVSEAPTAPTFGSEEIPTGPAGYQDKTRPISTDVVAAAERRIAERKKE